MAEVLKHLAKLGLALPFMTTPSGARTIQVHRSGYKMSRMTVQEVHKTPSL